MSERATPPLSLDYGATVYYRGKRFVISQESQDFTTVLLRDPDSDKLFQVSITDLSPVEAISSVPIEDIQEVNTQRLAAAERRFQIIKSLVGNPSRTGAEIKEVAGQHGLHFTTVYRYLRIFESTGRVSSLMRRVRLTKGKGQLDTAVEQVIKDMIDAHYLTRQKKRPAQVIREVLVLCRKLQLVPPHPNTVRNRIKRLDAFQKTRAREGFKAAVEGNVLLRGGFPGADYPLAVVQVDHTPIDAILVDDHSREPIGRPWITLLIDVFSRMVLGYYISFDPPGNLSLGLCLAQAFMPKEKFLAKQGIDAQWPCWGFPRTIHADNAREFRGDMLREACKDYGMNLEWRPVAKPHYGAYIERLLGTLNDEIKVLPGTTFSNVGQKGEYDSEGEAAMTLSEFEQWFTSLCVETYHHRRHSELGIPPIAKWEEGILGTKKAPGIGMPPRPTDDLRLKLDLMPFERRTVQPYGILWDHIEYQHDVLRRWVNAPDPDAPKQKRKFLCRRDPRDISRIWFYDPEVHQYYPIPYRNMAHPAISIWDLRRAQKAATEANQEIPVDEERIFKAHERRREIEECAKKKTKKVRRDNARRNRGITRSREHLADSTPPPPVDLPPVQLPEIRPFDDIDDMEDDR